MDGRTRVLPVAMVVGVLLVAVLALPTARADAQAQEPGRARPPALLLVFDASGSMRATDGGERRRIDLAREALRGLLDDVPVNAEIGLRAYGHRLDENEVEAAVGCTDTELLVPVDRVDRPRLLEAVDALEPSGFTPIGEALRAGIGDLPTSGPRTIVLVSDGLDTCAPPDPCGVAEELAGGDIDLTVETVGLRVDDEARAELTCIAEATGGTYRDATTLEELVRALRAYRLQGTVVEGGDTRADAPLLTTGQYRDSVEPGSTRWYRARLVEGQSLTASVTIVGAEGAPGAPDAEASLQVERPDPLGTQVCGLDVGRGIGVAPLVLAVDVAPQVGGQGGCAEPGEVLLRLDTDDAPALAGATIDVELLFRVLQEHPADDGPSVRPAERGEPSGLATLAETPVRGSAGGNGLVVAVMGFLGLALGAAGATVLGERR